MEVELVYNPDKLLSESLEIIATADSVILDRCARWTNLSASVIRAHVPQAHILDLRIGEP